MPLTKLYLEERQPIVDGTPVPLEGHEVKENKRAEQYVQFGQMMRFDELPRELWSVPFSRCVMYLGFIRGSYDPPLFLCPPLGLYNYSENGLYGEVYSTFGGWEVRAEGATLGKTHDFLDAIYRKKLKPTRTWKDEYRKTPWSKLRKTLREKIRDYFRPEPEVLWD